MDGDWTNSYRGHHDQAVQQGRKVAEIVMACNRDEPNRMLLHAVNEIAAELAVHRHVLAAIRMGIERGHLTGAEAAD
jgi:hypothetical protein